MKHGGHGLLSVSLSVSMIVALLTMSGCRLTYDDECEPDDQSCFDKPAVLLRSGRQDRWRGRTPEDCDGGAGTYGRGGANGQSRRPGPWGSYGLRRIHRAWWNDRFAGSTGYGGTTGVAGTTEPRGRRASRGRWRAGTTGRRGNDRRRGNHRAAGTTGAAGTGAGGTTGSGCRTDAECGAGRCCISGICHSVTPPTPGLSVQQRVRPGRALSQRRLRTRVHKRQRLRDRDRLHRRLLPARRRWWWPLRAQLRVQRGDLHQRPLPPGLPVGRQLRRRRSLRGRPLPRRHPAPTELPRQHRLRQRPNVRGWLLPIRLYGRRGVLRLRQRVHLPRGLLRHPGRSGHVSGPTDCPATKSCIDAVCE